MSWLRLSSVTVQCYQSVCVFVCVNQGGLCSLHVETCHPAQGSAHAFQDNYEKVSPEDIPKKTPDIMPLFQKLPPGTFSL